eukprot:TRINITY_DN3303_c2_g1_i1.p1 TRINITY_DN3303_c2_g1~~TRINITY_DN3303_c2_g1_i1.p1  ORF type:complete len:417 (+),score=72.87 TRINITY_DN3303_c2_g1_i1:65-1315(+)
MLNLLRQSRTLLAPSMAALKRPRLNTNIARSLDSPAQVGLTVEETVDTPALLVDLAVLEQNCARMVSAMAPYPNIAIRPHAKAHKSPDMAALTLKLTGAKGVCCQKLCEAEAMVEGGVKDILLSNEVVGRAKINRLCALASQPGVKMAVLADNEQNVADLASGAAEAGVTLDVIVEVDVGQKRCGVQPGKPAAVLAACIASHKPSLRFAGLQCYHGLTQHIRKVADRRAAILGGVAEATRASIEACKSAGLWSEGLSVTGGGTGSFLYEAETGLFNEVQPGSFIFMDCDYSANDWPEEVRFEPALHCLATVMSRPLAERAVLDSGTKALDLGSGPPKMAKSVSGSASFRSGGDEHGILDLEGAVASMEERTFAIGSKIWLQPSHCDPTVNLHDWFILHRDGVVEKCVPISARNPGR